MLGGHDGENSASWIIQARSRLALRRAEKPTTKAAQIRALWPDMEAALAVGQSMKTVCAWLAQDAGITLGVTSLTSYVSRIRRREEPSRCRRDLQPASDLTLADVRSPALPERSSIMKGPPISYALSERHDPLANLHVSQAKNPGFRYRPATAEDEKDLI